MNRSFQLDFFEKTVKGPCFDILASGIWGTFRRDIRKSFSAKHLRKVSKYTPLRERRFLSLTTVFFFVSSEVVCLQMIWKHPIATVRVLNVSCRILMPDLNTMRSNCSTCSTSCINCCRGEYNGLIIIGRWDEWCPVGVQLEGFWKRENGEVPRCFGRCRLWLVCSWVDAISRGQGRGPCRGQWSVWGMRVSWTAMFGGEKRRCQ